MTATFPLKELTPASHEVVYHYAYTHYKQGQYEEAQNLFRLLSMVDGSKRKFWMGLGLSLQANKKYKEAIAAFESAAILDMNDPHAHYQAAECFFALSNKEKGLLALKGAENAIKFHAPKEDGFKSKLSLLKSAWLPRNQGK